MEETSLTRPTQIRALLAELGLAPRKGMGQNFLIDANILRIIVDSAQLEPADQVLEIGPGLGVLTERLMAGAGRVVAVEKDRGFLSYLRKRLGESPCVELIEADAMHVDWKELSGAGVNKLVANLPYSVGSRILVELFQQQIRMERIVVTLQLDVARRLAAEVGTRDYGLLSIWAQLDHRVQVAKVVSPSCFHPPPKVTSAVVVMEPLDQPQVELSDREHFGRLIKWAFSQRRKQMLTVMQRAPGELRKSGEATRELFDQLSVNPRSRPAELPVYVWGSISNAMIRSEE